jgi:hypothetical protein
LGAMRNRRVNRIKFTLTQQMKRVQSQDTSGGLLHGRPPA